MRVHCIKHVPFEGPGYFENCFRERGWVLSVTELHADQELPDFNTFDLLLVMGGPMGVADENAYPWLSEEKAFIKLAIEKGKRMIGVCLGAQLLAEALCAQVSRNPVKEVGWFPVEVNNEGPLAMFPKTITPLHWHGDTFSLPERAMHLAKSNYCQNQAFSWNNGQVIGLQFHIEATVESLSKLIENCEDHQEKASTIQSADEMKAQSFHILSNMKLCEQLVANVAKGFGDPTGI